MPKDNHIRVVADNAALDLCRQVFPPFLDRRQDLGVGLRPPAPRLPLLRPQDVVDAVKKLQDHSTSCPSSISQRAALAALDMDAGYYSSIKTKFQERRDLIISYLDDRLKEFVSYIKPQGAFYLFINIAKTKLDSFDFSRRFLEESYVAVIPGGPFGCSSWIRISFAASAEEIKKGLQRLEMFLIKLKTEQLTQV